MDFLLLLSATFTLFAVIDIIGALPLIYNIKKTTNINPLWVSIYSTVIMLLFLYFGSNIFKLFSINPAHFALAGSLLILFFGIKMMFGLHFDYEKNESDEPNSSFFPVAFPLIAGPGTLSTIMSLKAEIGDVELIASILINAIIVYMVIRSADWIGRKIGASGITIIERIFGVFLLSIGIKMFITNLILVINLVI